MDDLDCPRGDFRCVEGTCEALPSNAAPVCAVTADCTGGRSCVDAECRFAPTCQTVLDGAPFRWAASCQAGGAQAGDASPTTSGCQISFALQGLAGQNRAVEVGPLSGEQTRADSVATAASGVSCAAGAWNGATSTLLLTGCDVDGDTCELALSRRRADQTLCLDDAACAGGETCAIDVESGAAIAGRCR